MDDHVARVDQHPVGGGKALDAHGLAGLGHLLKGGRNGKEDLAMLTDFLAFIVLAVFVVLRGLY